MKIATILDHIDSGHMALPEFQRGYVWNRDQVRGLFESLYKHHPVGGLLVWVTNSETASYRGDGILSPGIVNLILDGQQRVTSLYGVVRGKAPKFFDGNEQAFTGLYFNLETETFNFYQPMKMQGDVLWVNVTDLMMKGTQGIGEFATVLSSKPEYAAKLGEYFGRLSRLLAITEIDFHIEQVTGDKSLDVVVDIFNRVNSGGTKLSKGDLALAKICADWPEARATLKNKIAEWNKNDYCFNLDWFLRCINTILTGEAKFSFLYEKNTAEIQEAFKRSSKAIDTCLNLIAGNLGLDHDRVLFGRYAIPVMVRYVDQKKGPLGSVERDKLLFWFLQSGMWGRFSGSTESVIDRDLAAIEGGGSDALDRLLEHLRLWHGALRVEPGHFSGWSLGARFYPVLYMLTRKGEALDWGLGTPLKSSLLGKMSKLEIHHIFPRAQLYKHDYTRVEVNALANFCFLTKDTNLSISDRLPEDYFAEVETNHPGALASQWIPMDKNLWKINNYLDFLAARRELLAQSTNRYLEELLRGDTKWMEIAETSKPTAAAIINVGIADDTEEKLLDELDNWVRSLALPGGEMSFEYANPETGEQLAIFDLAWPSGLQEGLTEPVAVLLNEGEDVLALANKAGYRCFSDIDSFKNYVRNEVVKGDFAV